MIRERVPLGQFIQQENVQSLFRLWFCCYCGTDFSIKARKRPVACPLCLTAYEARYPSFHKLEKLLEWGRYLRAKITL